MWLEKAREAGFKDVAVLDRAVMDEGRVTRYPIYREGGLDALFDLVTPEQRWRLVESATIRAVKPRRSRKRSRAQVACRV